MSLQKFPGFIDIHVHLRDPGSTHKEDFRTGSTAGVAGGFTYLLDMPNNIGIPTVTIDRLEDKISLARHSALCDIGFHYGTDGKNLDTFSEASRHPCVFGLKVYCGATTGDMLINDESVLDSIFRSWDNEKPILIHAEGDALDICLSLSKRYTQRLHVCHIASGRDVDLVQQAKTGNDMISAGVTPHHLFLTQKDVEKLGVYGLVRPPIGDAETKDALWDAIKSGVIDIVESDHAPHTRKEKDSGTPPFGAPELDTMLGLMFLGVAQKRLTQEKVVSLLYDNPKRLFHIPEQPHTYIEADPQKPYRAGEHGYQTKCGWSPFDGWELYGKVQTVVLRNKPLVRFGAVL